MKKAIATLLLMFSVPAFAITAFLEREEDRGMYRACYYSDGRIITVPATSLCPLSIR